MVAPHGIGAEYPYNYRAVTASTHIECAIIISAVQGVGVDVQGVLHIPRSIFCDVT